MIVKHFVGDEYTGLDMEKVNWIKETFPYESYFFVDEGYFHYERYVVFIDKNCELLYRLRWTKDVKK